MWLSNRKLRKKFPRMVVKLCLQLNTSLTDASDDIGLTSVSMSKYHAIRRLSYLMSYYEINASTLGSKVYNKK